jgi:hypothetical protein
VGDLLEFAVFFQREIRGLQAVDVPSITVGNGCHDVHKANVDTELRQCASNQQ